MSKGTNSEMPSAAPTPTIAPSPDAWPALPPLTAEGYLSPEAGLDEFVHADVENGLWLYISGRLRVEIKRYHDPNIPLIWYESDIRTKGEDLLRSVPANPDKVNSIMNKPEAIARANRLVFGVNDDQFVYRRQNQKAIGMVVRQGRIYGSKSARSGGVGFPNLETLALFPDGSLKVYQSNEYAAQEYIDMGATDVFAFGPILVRDGFVNEKLDRMYINSLEPRCSLGMVEPCHYVSIVVEGRHSGISGANFLWLAQRMKMLGATQALNLDGGNTSALVFMGERLNSSSSGGPDSQVRSISGLIGIGTSGLVPE